MKLNKKGESEIHRIQEVPLEELNLCKNYEIEKILAEGTFTRIILATHRRTDTRIVLKAINQEHTTIKDFYREFHYA